MTRHCWSVRAGVSRRACGVAGMLAALVVSAVLAGCNEPPAVNPWRDDSIPRSVYGTASSEAIVQAGQAPAVRVRNLPQVAAPVARNEVPHYPLWWEDPFEDQGDNNDEFAWTWQDYLDMPYGLGRFMLNTMGWPVSAVVTPPGTPMVSDGVVEKVHDAKRGVSPDPVAGPADFDSTLPEGPSAPEPAESPGPQPAAAAPAGSQPAV